MIKILKAGFEVYATWALNKFVGICTTCLRGHTYYCFAVVAASSN